MLSPTKHAPAIWYFLGHQCEQRRSSTHTGASPLNVRTYFSGAFVAPRLPGPRTLSSYGIDSQTPTVSPIGLANTWFGAFRPLGRRTTGRYSSARSFSSCSTESRHG